MKKYHPNWIIVALILIGLLVLAVCVTGGIWLAHGLGVIFKKWGACPNYFTDFLGGAIGIILGFVFDKMCIESISHIERYKGLMRSINHELSNNKKALDELKIRIPSRALTDEEKYKIRNKQFDKLDDSEKHLFCVKKSLEKGNGSDLEKWEFYINGQSVYYWSAGSVKIRIVDDVVKNAETVATIINVPYASQAIKNGIIDKLGEIYDKLKKFDGCWGALKQGGRDDKTDETILEMLKLRDEINKLIG